MLQEDQFLSRRKDLSVAVLDRIEDQKLQGFAKRVVACLKTFDSAFSDEEVVLLVKSLDLVASEVREAQLVLRILFLQAVRSRAEPEELFEQLTGRGLDEARAKVLAKLWLRQKADLEAHFEKSPVDAKQVRSIDYRLAVTTATSAQRSVTRPVSTFCFRLCDEASDDSESEKRAAGNSFAVEFDHAELSKFHETVEDIQVALDALTS